ncbi:hypothetical protein Dsin_015746 [Dipteronia sinensis]|uniref:Zinc knuckle CX2CX4HX4C domain-containing protein n=1 Tax=Dipteronia sinensis TaxID=43782 RepID=A0AAE0E5B4_9ROSI|nr:hypothetical protein Dsin_015746 [Dipteronia sinensis]
MDSEDFSRICDEFVLSVAEKIHKIPLICLNKKVAVYLGNLIGKLKDIDSGASGVCCGKFLRILVGIDISQPLKRAIHVSLDGEAVTVLLLYEKLPNVCSNCVIIGHVVGCYLSIKEWVLPSSNYGAWIHAAPPNRNKGRRPRFDQHPTRNVTGKQPARDVSHALNGDPHVSEKFGESLTLGRATGQCFDKKQKRVVGVLSSATLSHILSTVDTDRYEEEKTESESTDSAAQVCRKNLVLLMKFAILRMRWKIFCALRKFINCSVLMLNGCRLMIEIQAESEVLIKGVRYAWNSPRVSHFLFADGNIIFCDATLESFAVVTNWRWQLEIQMWGVVRLPLINSGDLFGDCLFLPRNSLVYGGSVKETYVIIFSSMNFLDEYKTLMRNPSFAFVLREGNRVVHALAKFACSSSEDKIWLSVCPIFVHSLVSADFS